MDRAPLQTEQRAPQPPSREPAAARDAFVPDVRSLDAAMLLRLQETAGNAAVARLATGRVAPGGRALQRAVGFEFQTNWGVIEKRKGRFGSKRSKMKKAELLHPYPGFNLTADEAGTDLGAELEWVVDPPIPETAGVAALAPILQALETAAGRMVAFQNRDAFMLDEATGDPRDATLEIHPKIKGAGPGQDMKANPQVTGGMRLDQMVTMFHELHAPSGQHAQAQQELVGMGGSGLLEGAAARADSIPGSDKLKGLAAQVMAYLRAGALLGMQPSPSQAYDYAKLIGKIMARTDFGSQFLMLDPAERRPFEANPRSFATLVLNAAQLPGNVAVFERKIKNVAGQAAAGVFDFPVTREDWLVGIVRGHDLLSSKHMPHWKSELEGLGALGAKTDPVGQGERGVVAEFRLAQPQMPYTQWRGFGTRVFSYLIDLNQRESPQQERARLLAELPGGF